MKSDRMAGRDGSSRILIRVIIWIVLNTVLAAAAQAVAGRTDIATRTAFPVGDFSGGLEAGGAPKGWQLVRHAGKPDLRLAREDGFVALELYCDKASFGLQRKLVVDLGAYPRLSWKWRADKLPTGGDFRSASTNDQAAELYVAFPGMRVIGYSWETEVPEGTMGNAIGIPAFARVKVLVLRSGRAHVGIWLTEERDLAADYRRLFGEELPDPKALGIRVYINSQHTRSEAACAFADIVFQGGVR